MNWPKALKFSIGQFSAVVVASLVFGLVFWWSLIPGWPVLGIYIVEVFTGHISTAVGPTNQTIPHPSVSSIELATRIQERLHRMSDNELRLISDANRPCKSKLINECYGFIESYVRKLAADERLHRAQVREDELKERNTAANEAVGRAAMKNAKAAAASAKAAVASAEAAQRNAVENGFIAFGTCLTALFGGVGLIRTFRGGGGKERNENERQLAKASVEMKPVAADHSTSSIHLPPPPLTASPTPPAPTASPEAQEPPKEG